MNHCVYGSKTYRLVWSAWFFWVYFPLFLCVSPRRILVTERTKVNSWAVGKGSGAALHGETPAAPQRQRSAPRAADTAAHAGPLCRAGRLQLPCTSSRSSLFTNHSHIELKDELSRRECWAHRLAERAGFQVQETKRRMSNVRPGRCCLGGKECWSWPLPSLYSALKLNAGLA